MTEHFTIVGLGEALFDLFPGRQVLGGAPLNAAVHAHQLARASGGRGTVVSRVGQDALGERVATELTQRGMDSTFLQRDPDHPTGKVHVTVDEGGQPDYDIAENAAWDWIQWDPDLEQLAHDCDAVCFSSLAQRHNQSRSSVQRFLTEARGAIRLFDLTIRQDYHDRRTLLRSCELSTIVKLNLEELAILAEQAALPGDDVDARATALRRRFDLKLVVVTRGAAGTVLYSPTRRYEGAPTRYTPAANADSVGAGDACTAAVLVGLILRLPLPEVVDLANHAGAYVASVPGATPALPEALLARVKPA